MADATRYPQSLMAFSHVGAVLLIGGAIPNQYFGFRVYLQSSTGSISGSVTDEAGALVIAKVAGINRATGGERAVTTNATGYFLIPFLPPARYTVRVQK